MWSGRRTGGLTNMGWKFNTRNPCRFHQHGLRFGNL